MLLNIFIDWYFWWQGAAQASWKSPDQATLFGAGNPAIMLVGNTNQTATMRCDNNQTIVLRGMR